MERSWSMEEIAVDRARTVQDVVDKSRSLTDDEDAHDDNENDWHVLLIPALAHLGPSSLPSLQRLDQFHVEEGDEKQRSAVDDDEVEDVGVDDAIETIAAERTDLEDLACLVDSDANRYALVLQEPLLPFISEREQSTANESCVSKQCTVVLACLVCMRNCQPKKRRHTQVVLSLNWALRQHKSKQRIIFIINQVAKHALHKLIMDVTGSRTKFSDQHKH